MKISIIVPIYKVEAYLERCVTSLINQSYKDIEIILVDDGSPDRCPHICDYYATTDSRIKVIHKKNEGQGAARNDAVSITNGDYICFVDGDDFIALDAIETFVNATENGKYDIVNAAFYNSWTPTSNFSVFYALNEIKEGKEEITCALGDLTASKWDDPVPAYRFMGVCGGIIRTSIIKTNNISFHSVKEVCSEDLLFLYDLYPYVTSIKYIPKPLYYYCLNTTSTSRSFNPDAINAIDRLIYYLRKSPLAIGNDEIGQRIIKLYIYKCGIFHSQILQSRLPLKEKKRLCNLIYSKKIWKDIAEKYEIKLLPHSYRYYISIFTKKQFLKSYIRHKLYKLRKGVRN